jgi:NADH-quinone oxidoreductase subunit G
MARLSDGPIFIPSPAAREVSGTGELMVSSRGSKEEIDIFPGFPLDNKLSGNVVDLCPVGALGDKDFLYQQRVWFLKREAGVCGGCSAGCSIHTEHNQDTVYRLKPRENPHVNKWWICDEGRYGWHHLHDPSRLVEPKRQRDGQRNGDAESVEWADIIGRVRDDLSAAVADGGRLAVAVSPMLTVEEAWMLCSVARSIDPQALLAVGFVPTRGEDESFPGGFTIRGEKCPNRVGVEHVVASFDPTIPRWDALLDAVEAGSCTAAWISAAYPPAENRPASESAPWIDEATAARFEKLRCLIVQDLFASPLTARADWLLPAAGFAERSGTWVNHAQWAQSFERAIRPPSGVWPEGRLLWNMLGHHRLYDPAVIRREIAAASIALAALSDDLPPVGLDLRLQQLASS